MTLMIRDFRPADAEAAAAAYSAGRPHLLMTPETVGYLTAHVSPKMHYRLLVAELDGRVVGTVRCGVHADSSTPGQGFANVSVLPEHRRQGAGGALLQAAEKHLAAYGVTQVHAWADDEPAAQDFAARRGYRRGRICHFAHLDLTAGLRPVPPLPSGIELRQATEYLDDPYPLYEVDVAGALDEPGDVDASEQEYEAWLAEIWNRPDLDRELTVVAVADGRPVAFSAVQTDGGSRYWSAFTTTRAEYRGRGLAKLAKTHSLHRALAAGLTDAYTNNDATNAPMLAINDWLGYRRCASEWKFIRDLSADGNTPAP
ncbi:GNAT family N-acetyltransferase [Kitasatospora atroaurantiaca]|uniref:Ribosomal protein S18 acetylase RimI-like enzyme n=1 Tax=Kitasatospora atroaurantiaca TaxID=285545 RepID=A0A561EWP7_9ACTN|nr:GNAT family N-acetyltransferase [Kitasatospora atroaurantiaca]TWE20028.1 ribosomal protein S18 acetylase RimI-like enzyme [Kitasatospora atroaurantiaca]